MTNWEKLKSTAQGVHGAQETFKILEKLARQMKSIIKPQYKTFSSYVRLVMSLVRYYDIGAIVNDDIKSLILLLGAVGNCMFGILSMSVGGISTSDGEIKSHLSGPGASNLTDFFLHGVVFISMYDIPPILFNERINEQKLSKLSSVKDKSHNINAMKDVAQELITNDVVAVEKAETSRREYDRIDFLGLSDLLIHHCISETVFGLRNLLQFVWTMKKFVSKHKISFYNTGAIMTNTGLRDSSFDETHIIACCCGASYNKCCIDNERYEVSMDEFVAIMQLKLYIRSNDSDKKLNIKFPGLTSNQSINYNHNTLNKLTIQQLKIYLSANYLSVTGNKNALISRIKLHMNSKR
eukprot:32600_1